MNVAGVWLLVWALLVVLAGEAVPRVAIATLWVVSMALVIVGAGMTRFTVAQVAARPHPSADPPAS
jgi:hypothetical protein